MSKLAVKITDDNREFLRDLCEELTSSPYSFVVFVHSLSDDDINEALIHCSFLCLDVDASPNQLVFSFNENMNDYLYSKSKDVGGTYSEVMAWLEDHLQIDPRKLFIS